MFVLVRPPYFTRAVGTVIHWLFTGYSQPVDSPDGNRHSGFGETPYFAKSLNTRNLRLISTSDMNLHSRFPTGLNLRFCLVFLLAAAPARMDEVSGGIMAMGMLCVLCCSGAGLAILAFGLLRMNIALEQINADESFKD